MSVSNLRLGLAVLIAAGFVAPGRSAAQGDANPHAGSPAAIRAGRALFANRCAECHGADATGISGPDLTGLWADGPAEGRVFRTIRDGLAGSIMPPSTAPDDEIWAIVSYLESLGTVSPLEFASGDAGRGEASFGEYCARCHRAGGRGGRLGPVLSRITRTRSRASLVRAIRQPDAAVAAGYRVVTVVPRTGDPVRGLLKGEDAFSVQILDTTERLRGFRRRDLREVREETGSLMPAFAPSRLGDGALDDLLRFLASVSGAEGR